MQGMTQSLAAEVSQLQEPIDLTGGGASAVPEFESRNAGLVSLFSAFFLLGMITVVLALGFPYTHDEELYVTPARMAADLRLYADFFFHQTPYYASILAPVLTAVQSTHVFTVARLFSALGGLLLMIVRRYR